MSIRELTLEELIAKQQENKASKLARNAENIAKISGRIASAPSEAEKRRLEDLLKAHQAHTATLEAIDPVAVATERFEKNKTREEAKIDVKPE